MREKYNKLIWGLEKEIDGWWKKIDEDPRNKEEYEHYIHMAKRKRSQYQNKLLGND